MAMTTPPAGSGNPPAASPPPARCRSPNTWRSASRHPEHGYYMTRDPFGAAGDFITAPEISQMFGELIGLWAAAVWRQMGSPENVRLVELGPGRGTMMADALRAAKVVPDFRAALVVHLVEISPALAAAASSRRSSGVGVPVALARRARRGAGRARPSSSPTSSSTRCRCIRRSSSDDGWHERVVKIDDNGKLAVRPSLAIRCRMFEQLLPQRCATRRSARSSNGARIPVALELGRRVARSRRRRAGDRLRPCRKRGRRHVAGGRASMPLPIRWRRRAGRSHRACRFPGARAGRRKHRRAHPWPARSRANSSAGSASRPAPTR